MSKFQSALNFIRRCANCCHRSVDIIDRMTKEQEEEKKTEETKIERLKSAKIIIGDGSEAKIFEYNKPISVVVEGNVHVVYHSHFAPGTPVVNPFEMLATITGDVAEEKCAEDF
jgi:hypothetical protein